MAISDIVNLQERVENSVYEVIRGVLVAEGYTPDITLFTNNPAGQLAFDAAEQGIVATKGFCIALFGPANMQSRGTKKVPRIVIEVRRVLPGDLGNPNEPVLQPNANTGQYESVKVAPMSSNIEIDIRLVSNKTLQVRVMNAVVGEAIGQRKYIQLSDDPTNPIAKFLMYQSNYRDTYDYADGVTQNIYTYTVPDLYLTPIEIINPLIPPISQITEDVNSGQNTDDLVIS